jgi:hypothetical protein
MGLHHNGGGYVLTKATSKKAQIEPNFITNKTKPLVVWLLDLLFDYKNQVMRSLVLYCLIPFFQKMRCLCAWTSAQEIQGYGDHMITLIYIYPHKYFF